MRPQIGNALNAQRLKQEGEHMSGRLPDAWLEELRTRTSLEEVVSEYVPLKQKGRR